MSDTLPSSSSVRVPASVYARFLAPVREAIARLQELNKLPHNLDDSRITVDPPKDASHGDLATNAAMILAKPAGQSPLVLGAELALILAEHPDIETATCVAPGFINMRLVPRVWHGIVLEILNQGLHFGRSTLGQGERVNVEYVSVNPTGPMHAGHTRVAIVGDVLANVLDKAGYAVTREFYINDAGGQVDTLARSVYVRYQQALGHAVDGPGEGLYPGEYLIPVGQSLAQSEGARWIGQHEADWLPFFRAASVDAMMVLIRKDLQDLGVHHDLFSSEKLLADDTAIRGTIEALDQAGLIYTGVLEAPKGKTPDDWEPRPQLLFRSTQFGDDTDRPLQKSDGRWTYFAADVAYHASKFERGFSTMINVWGADHGGYIKRIQSAVAALSHHQATLEVLICQMVQLVAQGEALKMSKRAGTFITLQEMLEKVGKDVVRFMMMMRKNDAAMDFDFDKVLEQTKENPVFYVQYAHARACSVVRQAELMFPGIVQRITEADVHALTHASELTMIRKLAEWPRQVEAAARYREPHRIAFYLYDVASEFHMMWSRGKEEATLRFLFPQDEDRSRARVALVHAVRTVIASGLAVLGVTALEEMRA